MMTRAEAEFLSYIVRGLHKKLEERTNTLTQNMHEVRKDVSKIRKQLEDQEMPDSLAEWEKLLPDAIVPLVEIQEELLRVSETILNGPEGVESTVIQT